MVMLEQGEFLLRLFAAMLLGLLIGLEREYRSGTPRAAGMRTLSLVALGSALFTLISAYGFTAFTSAVYSPTDPARVAAQIVTGIGFLGAGAILLQKQYVRGLTTAAAIWAVAAIGMACGLGLYVEAVGATALALTVLEVLRPLESRLFPRRHQTRISIRLVPNPPGDPLDIIAPLYRDLALSPRRLIVTEGEHDALIVLEFTPHQTDNIVQLVERLRAVPTVSAIKTELTAPKGTVKLPEKSQAQKPNRRTRGTSPPGPTDSR